MPKYHDTMMKEVSGARSLHTWYTWYMYISIPLSFGMNHTVPGYDGVITTILVRCTNHSSDAVRRITRIHYQ